MKPRIKKVADRWWCWSDAPHCTGFGNTPQEAFMNWTDRVLNSPFVRERK